jgi:hypothetical protein
LAPIPRISRSATPNGARFRDRLLNAILSDRHAAMLRELPTNAMMSMIGLLIA